MTNKKLLFFFLIWSNCLFSQGLIIGEQGDTLYQQLPTLPIVNDGAKSTLNAIHAWSLKPYCPTPKHQGKNGSCVGWAVGYAALTIQHALVNNWKGQSYLITQNAFSPMFIYNQIKTGDCQSGSYIQDALALLKNKGALLATDFDSYKNCAKLPTEEDLAMATANKIENFHALFPTDASSQTKINQIKLSLTQNHPVIVGMKLPQNFNKIKRKNKYWKPKIRKKTKFFGHSMVVVGFDDSRGAFEVMNSWGNKWGNNGFIWIKYRDFAKYCKYAFLLELPKKTTLQNQYTGQFHLRKFQALMANGQALFSDEKVQLTNGIYRLQNKAFSTQTIFQLSARQLSEQTYLYAFGLESNGTIKTYWPTESASPLIEVSEKEIYIPSADAGLQFKKSGKEWIILLYATKAIPDITQRKIALGKAKGKSMLEKLQSVFGAAFVPPQLINYHPKEMKFAVNLSQGYIIPVIIEVVVE